MYVTQLEYPVHQSLSPPARMQPGDGGFTAFTSMTTVRHLPCSVAESKEFLYLFFGGQAWHGHVGAANGLNLFNVLEPVFAEELE